MPQLVNAAFFLAVILYSAASTLFFLDLVRPGVKSNESGPRLLLAAGLLHGLHIVGASVALKACPVESLHFAVTFSAWLMVVIYALVRRRLRVDALGALVGPLALAFFVGAEFLGDRPPASLSSDPLLLLHVAANVFGVGLFLLAGASGAFYVVEERRLKSRRLGLSSRLPPLASLDRATHRLLLAGFPLLTFGIVTGSLFVGHLADASGRDLLRLLLGYTSWLVLGLVLIARRVVGWSGRRAAYGTLAGVGCVLLVMLVYVVKVPAG
jgi:ABC-type uncharacterized transport system permease subunit